MFESVKDIIVLSHEIVVGPKFRKAITPVKIRVALGQKQKFRIKCQNAVRRSDERLNRKHCELNHMEESFCNVFIYLPNRQVHNRFKDEKH